MTKIEAMNKGRSLTTIYQHMEFIKEIFREIGTCKECSLVDDTDFCIGKSCHGDYIGDKPNWYCADFERKKDKKEKK